MTAAELIQLKINATQDLDAIEYGIRCVNYKGYDRKRRPLDPVSEAYQIESAVQAATRVTGAKCSKYNLVNAKRVARAKLVDVNAALKAHGTKSQLRLELAA